METVLNRSIINSLLAVIAPGASLLLCIIWGGSVFYHHGQPNYVNDGVSIFLLFIFSYLIGIFIDSISQKLEKKFLKAIYGDHPTLVAINDNKHWLDDLDEFYLSSINVSLYDLDKKTMQPKPGNYNGKKIEKYNLTQFERFASFVLSKENIDGKTDHLRSKYLLLRNLAFTFLLCSITSGMFFFLGYLNNAAKDVFYDPCFVLASCIGLSIVSIYLFRVFRNSRLEYLTELYRHTRYHYLLNIKK